MDDTSDRNSVLSEDLPEYLFSDSDSEMGTLVEEGHLPERIYVHQLNLTSADVVRRRRDKEMVQEEESKVKEMRDIKRRQREEEKKRDMEMLQTYNPWGKPGAGAKGEDSKRKKYPEGLPPEEDADEEETQEGFIRKFGRPGNGAPVRTESGRIRTQIPGDPSIRFQDTQHVRLSIENHLRYKNEDKENYRGNLDELIQEKLRIQEQEKEWEDKKLEEMLELYPFGRGGQNGGSYLSQADPMFMATQPKKAVNFNKDEFDPWGKGFGNPARDRLGNVQRSKVPQNSQDDSDLSLGLRRARGGNGAPLITESGHPRTRLKNTLRNIKAMGPHIDEDEAYNPWGKPGAGAPFVREEDGMIFEEKMGWSLSGDPKKRSKDAKQEYMNTLQQEMEERRIKDEQERLRNQEPGAELASIIRRGVGGRPLKNPITGDLLPNPRRLTDVTQQRLDIRRAKSQESLQYFSELSEQAAQRQRMRQQQKQVERAQSEKHMSTLDTFWGRPGHGAPRDPENHKKVNLLRMLQAEQSQPYVKHYVTEIVPSKHKNRYEFPITQDLMAVKRDYEFRTPFPATEA